MTVYIVVAMHGYVTTIETVYDDYNLACDEMDRRRIEIPEFQYAVVSRHLYSKAAA